MTNRVTIVQAYWNNAGMASYQAKYMDGLPRDIKGNLSWILVDDCSDIPPNVPELSFSYRQYRIKEHRRWDWLICRNLGMAESVTEWVIMTDIDHIVPEETLRDVINRPLDVNKAYRFERVTLQSKDDIKDVTPYKPHNDTWMMTREAFNRVGRYYENFSGYYGSSGEFTARVEKTLGKPERLPGVLIRVPREVIPDASTPRELKGEPTRKTPKDRAGMIEARRRVARGEPIKYLSLPWERVR